MTKNCTNWRWQSKRGPGWQPKRRPPVWWGDGSDGAYLRTSDRVLWRALPLCPHAQSGGGFRCSKWNRSNSFAEWYSLTDCRFARLLACSIIHESPFERRSKTRDLAVRRQLLLPFVLPQPRRIPKCWLQKECCHRPAERSEAGL